MIDDQQDDSLRALAADYNDPPPVPREEIWARIQAARKAPAVATPADQPAAPGVLPFRRTPSRRAPAARALAWVTGAAALLALGIGIGRLSTGSEPPAAEPVAAGRPGQTGSERAAALLTVAVNQYLGRTETLLTGVRTGDVGNEYAGAASELLSMTRLLLDSPALGDPATRELLSDLELVLTQIVVLPATGNADQERTLITAGMEHHNLMPRLRSAIPANAVAGIQGEL